METAEKIRKGFIEYILENDKAPSSIYVLAKKLEMQEEEFYAHYNTVEAIEKAIWLGWFEETRQKIENDEVYESYSVREKVLAFYFTWLELLKSNRSYVLYRNQHRQKLDLNPYYIQDFKKDFKNFIDILMIEGKESQEVAERTFISEAYPNLFWVQVLTILGFWSKDYSPNFEQTDAFVEKSVNFAFDLIGKTALDSAFDYFKFVIQNRI